MLIRALTLTDEKIYLRLLISEPVSVIMTFAELESEFNLCTSEPSSTLNQIKSPWTT